LIIDPFDGDNGEYDLLVRYGIRNTSDIPVQTVKINVQRNLSTLWIKVHLDPNLLEYKTGDRIDAELRWGGYNSSLKFLWVWEIDDLLYEKCDKKCSWVYTNLSGEWNVCIFIEGDDNPVFSKSFMVKEKKKSNDIKWTRIMFNSIIFLIFVAAGIWGFFMYRKLKRYRINSRTEEGDAIPYIPQGFRSAPGIETGTRMDSDQVFYSDERGNNYTEDTESTIHDASNIRGEEGP
jgi:hypothetical protein